MNSLNNFDKAIKNIIHWFWNHPGRNLLFAFFISVFLFILAAKGFFEITDSLLEKELPGFDSKVSTYIHSYRTDTRTFYMLIITHLGDKHFYLPFFGFFLLVLLLKKKKLQPFFAFVFVSFSGHAINILLKFFFERPRPKGLHLIIVNEASYPSGHAMSSTIIYGYLTFLIWHMPGNTVSKTLVTLLSITLVFFIGISRVYLGVHYPSDVLAGQTVGLMWLFLVIMFIQMNGFIKRSQGINQE